MHNKIKLKAYVYQNFRSGVDVKSKIAMHHLRHYDLVS